MNRSLRNLGLFGAASVCYWIADWGNPLSAQQESMLVEEPSSQPELIPAVPSTLIPARAPFTAVSPQPPLQQGSPEEMAPPPAAAVTVHPVARIDYDVTHRARKLFGGSPFVQLSMVTQNPADGCFYEIPLCLPACCTGEPKMTSHCGLLGRGVVVYCYECGLEVEVKFRLRGDVEVEYGT